MATIDSDFDGSGRNYQALANAIVEQAAQDYLNLLLGVGLSPAETARNRTTLTALHGFFYSDYFTLLTKLDPDYLVGELKRRAQMTTIEYVAVKCPDGLYRIYSVRDPRTPIGKPVKSEATARQKAAKLQNTECNLYTKLLALQPELVAELEKELYHKDQ